MGCWRDSHPSGHVKAETDYSPEDNNSDNEQPERQLLVKMRSRVVRRRVQYLQPSKSDDSKESHCQKLEWVYLDAQTGLFNGESRRPFS
jgi:hypothetical protein